MWVERGKSVLLNFLVILSLVLSWLLLNSQPKYDYLHPAEYVDRQPFGEKRDIKELVKPQSIVFHYGDKRFNGAFPDSPSYRMVIREMEKWYFFNLQKVNLTAENVKDIINNRKAMEIIYPTEIPTDLIGELFAFRGKTEYILPSVKRIIIYIDDSDKETYALFTDNLGDLIQARTAITSRDLEQLYLSNGTNLPALMPVALSKEEGEFPIYIPSESITMQEYRYISQQIPASQMIQTLFVDPTMIRQVTERDGTTIYTDGSKAVQLPPNLRSIHFHDPVAESLEPATTDSHFHSVVNFVNEHGGWNGNYMLEGIKKIHQEGLESYQFREYVGSYPFYGVTKEMLGAVEVVTQRSYISGFNRSLINLDTYFDHQDIKVTSGQELLAKLTAQGVHLDSVTDMYLGYQAKINDNHVIFSPKWVIKLVDKEPLLMEAKRAETKEENHGLEKSQDPTHRSLPSFR
jgi:regulatory protein YycH of two-component signal transduction system YycFG